MRTILVSGGNGYLAKDLIKLMKNDGCRFILVDISYKKGVLEEGAYFMNTDITDGTSLEKQLLELNLKKRFKLDGIVNTPAWNNFKPLRETTYPEIEQIISTKLKGYANVIKACQPYLSKGSSIVNVGSVQAHTSRDPGALYAAANGGVISLTKALAVEFRKGMNRVNVVTPGGFDSTIYKKAHPDWQIRVRNGQCLKTRDVSKAIRFLLSDESRGINGTEIIVDGGISALRVSSSDF